jgi:diguanylate cyclase (GGDEF)-like protein/PAS domain S-box-containing protein
MPAAPLPLDEEARLDALRRLGVLDTPDEERFDRLVRLAAAALDMPIALVSLVDERRQWFKARVGLAVRETPREMAFCGHAILQPSETLVVADTWSDPRFADNPLVVGDPSIRFYAGRVMCDAGGQALGTLCVIDRRPREFDAHHDQVLTDLAHLVERELNVTDRDEVVVALERSERSKAILLDTLAEGLVVQDRDGRIVEWNRAATRLLGLSDDELGARTSIDPRWRAVRADGSPWPGDTHPAMEALGTGAPVCDQTMGVHRSDGSLVWLRVNSRPIRDRGGNVTSVLTVFADIAAEFDSARASETMALRLRQAVDSSGIGTALLAADGTTLFVNQAYSNIIGVPHSQILGRPPTVWIHPADPQCGARDFASISEQPSGLIASEIRLVDDEGAQRWVRANLTRLVDDSSHVSNGDRFVLQFEDVSEQRQLRLALAQSEEISRASLDALEQGVVLADPTGAVHQINPAAVDILGYTGPELTALFRSGRWESFDEEGHPLPPGERPLRQVVEQRRPVRRETLGWRHRDGHLVLLRLSCTPIADSDTAEGRFVIAFTDVTEQRRAERLLDTTFAMAPVGLAVIDDHGALLRWNPAFASHTGGPADRVLGDALGDLVDRTREARSHDVTTSTELQLVAPDDSVRWVEARAARIVDVEQRLGILATFDITERKRLELDLDRFAHLFQHSNDIITVVDPTGHVLYASPSNERVLGYPVGWRSAGGILDLVHPDDLEGAAANFTALLAGRRGSEPFTMRVRTHTGEWRYIETVGVNLLAEPSVLGIVLTSRDVTERQILNDELAHRAAHDALTDLPNRATAEQRIHLAIARARQERNVAAVCYIDLDGFKTVNDTLGHSAGDAALVEVARRLAGSVRGTDLAARIGGDEFVVVLENVGDADCALDITQRLLQRLTTPPLRSGDLTVDVSIGVALSQPDDSANTLLSRADVALYRAKSLPGSCIVRHDDIQPLTIC